MVAITVQTISVTVTAAWVSIVVIIWGSLEQLQVMAHYSLIMVLVVYLKQHYFANAMVNIQVH